MESSQWIAIYLPIFILLFVILPSQRNSLRTILRMKKKRGQRIMSNELIKSCIGKICTISTGSLGSSYSSVKVVNVVDNWMKIEKKGKEDLVNVDYVTNIRIVG